MTTEYGFFDSAFSAADAVAGSIEQGQLVAGKAGLFWVEFRPEDKGRTVLCLRDWQGELQDLTPEPFTVRSRVYEYGGKSWCLLGCLSGQASQYQFAFVNGADQQIWLQSIGSRESPQPQLQPVQLTHERECRYGDLIYDPQRQRIIAVQEKATADPTQPDHSLVAIALQSGVITCLSEGQDFYASPCLNNSGNQLAWISWNHPHMPWVNTRLSLANLSNDGSVINEDQVAGAGHLTELMTESLQQPRFLPDGSLSAISDNNGWWNLYRYLKEGGGVDSRLRFPSDESGVEGVWPAQAEFGIAQWQLGVSTWDWMNQRTAEGHEALWLVASFLEQGKGYLGIRLIDSDLESEESVTLLAPEFSLFRHICCYKGKIYCIANSESRTPAILEITPGFETAAQVRVLSGNKEISGLEKVSLPRTICYPVAADEVAHGFLYLPQLIAGSDTKPPLLVFTHGGPTGTTYPVFNPKIQFWTERGFAVVDLNYRGSAGYGRDYRHRLAGQWGVSDVEDAVAAADYLVKNGATDSHNLFIRGGSAGGYTTLCSLAFSDRFRGGASYYGVSDPMTLTRDTHKFESHYLDWLIGDPDTDASLYQRRSPLLAADQINCPMIFFQGGQDKVVVPDQTERMVAALQQNAIEVEYHLYPDEQHGFRSSENQVDSLDAELAFYRSLLRS
ncbi:alpha/beta hydrolase family protein [Amphritea balenae]|uniref:S9 family peptidase n=1 Tax=Amphritea balenae TaxID=452629 RepID=A0A3P1STJ7_9GAMM|nr:prolyl oligopeptidase family serine peptidase [Amphritea balenae]RRD00534.1 S9 family peptidase [Amphritea balenae]GGK69923.1 peptidase S9 [Amphritea balenae]